MALWKRLETNCPRRRSKSNLTILRSGDGRSPRTPANVFRLGESGGALALGSFSAPRRLGEVIYLFLSQVDNHGGLAQLVERVLSMHEVVDSISTFSMSNFPHAPVAPHSLLGCASLPTCQVFNFFMFQVSNCHPVSSAMRCVCLNNAVSGVQPAANSEMPYPSG